ncbi:MAG: TraM recognition domain-containing protein [Xanthobacteraceae bacterium]
MKLGGDEARLALHEDCVVLPGFEKGLFVRFIHHKQVLRAFKEAVTLLRGYGLRCCLFLQSHAQLKSLYPHDHEAITENCGAIVTFGHTSMGMSRPIADLLGDISADTLFGMTRDQIAVRMAGEPTVIARRLDYLTDGLFAGKFDANRRYR